MVLLLRAYHLCFLLHLVFYLCDQITLCGCTRTRYCALFLIRYQKGFFCQFIFVHYCFCLELFSVHLPDIKHGQHWGHM